MQLGMLASYSEAITIIAIGLIAGLVTDQVVFHVLKSRFEHKASTPGLMLAHALHWLPTVTGLLVGVAIAADRMPLSSSFRRDIHIGVRVLAILALTAFAARILGRIVRLYTAREDTKLPASSIFVNLTRGVVWTIGCIALLASIGISITPLITALGVGGLAVGLALQPTLENVFSGVQMLASRQIEPGDFIRLDTGEEGTVLDVTWRNTTVQRTGGELVIVPNSVIGRALVTNFSRGASDYTLLIPVTVAYGSDLDAVERIALEAAREVIAQVDGAIRDSEPVVRFADLTPPTVTFNTAIKVTSYTERLDVRSEFIRRLQDRISAEGIEAPPVTAFAAGTAVRAR